MRTAATIFILGAIFSSIGYLFYSQEVKYWTPTPIPLDYEEIEIGQKVAFGSLPDSTRKFFHFYNPNCPCSRFNTRNYKSLLKKYSAKFDCYVVIQKTLDGLPDSDIEFLEGLGVNVISDVNKEIADILGVYSTPQMVLVDEQNRVYYRGNYNQARYCTNPASSFAEMAIDSLLNGAQYSFPAAAFTAYGCSLNRPTD